MFLLHLHQSQYSQTFTLTVHSVWHRLCKLPVPPAACLVYRDFSHLVVLFLIFCLHIFSANCLLVDATNLLGCKFKVNTQVCKQQRQLSVWYGFSVCCCCCCYSWYWLVRCRVMLGWERACWCWGEVQAVVGYCWALHSIWWWPAC